MSRVLVAYGTKHGATREIAEAIAEELREAGHEVDCLSAELVQNLDAYDAAVIGSAVYMKRWRREAHRLLKREAKALAATPLWIFSSGPCGENPDPSWSEPRKVVSKVERLGTRDHVVFGGRLPLEPSGFIERGMVNSSPPEHRDLRDWDAIRKWAGGIATELGRESVSPAEPPPPATPSDPPPPALTDMNEARSATRPT